MRELRKKSQQLRHLWVAEGNSEGNSEARVIKPTDTLNTSNTSNSLEYCTIYMANSNNSFVHYNTWQNARKIKLT